MAVVVIVVVVVVRDSHQQHLRPQLARSLASILVNGSLASTSAAWLRLYTAGTGAPKSARWVCGWRRFFFFFFFARQKGQKRASERAREPGCGCVMDGCLSSPPPGRPPPSGREWSGALHHICLRGNILQQLMGTAAAAASAGSYMMSAGEWVFAGTTPPLSFSLFSFCYKRRHFVYFRRPRSSFGSGAVVLRPRLVSNRVWKPD